MVSVDIAATNKSMYRKHNTDILSHYKADSERVRRLSRVFLLFQLFLEFNVSSSQEAELNRLPGTHEAGRFGLTGPSPLIGQACVVTATTTAAAAAKQ